VHALAVHLDLRNLEIRDGHRLVGDARRPTALKDSLAGLGWASVSRSQPG